MKRWPLVVAVLYCVVLAVLTLPAIMLAFGPASGLLHHNPGGNWVQSGGSPLLQAVKPGTWISEARVYLTWQFWLWLAVMGISQFLLLAVPVRVAGGRPVFRSSVWRTVIATGLMAGGLVTGALFSIYEFVLAPNGGNGPVLWICILVGLLMWVTWSVIFARMSRSAPPADFVSRQCRLLFKGSILELLVAVPTHIVARWRDYCCAGFWTFFGLTMGISVMLFAFGPSVLYLFMARWKRVHKERRSVE